MSDVSRLLARVDELSAALAEAQRERDERDEKIKRLEARLAAALAVRDAIQEDRDGWQAKAARMLPVVEAASQFRHQEPGRMTGSHELYAAVDTYETQTGGTDG